ncbi:MAG: methyltransferase domain-containing protein [Fischerella sp.]|nr:methyltransferase domain-containing protein [Fischerella sp.]
MQTNILPCIKIDEKQLISLARKRQEQLEAFIYFQLLPQVFNKSIQKTKHFEEWYHLPMNYVRVMELPLTLEMLELDKDLSILDISSPKLLALYLAANKFNKLTISDLTDYYLEDFRIFSSEFQISPKLEVFDATSIPHADKTFDRIFSVSVFEHIPDFGDISAVKEVARVLKPEGIFVLTLPAHKTYFEEWLVKKNFYWPGKTRDDQAIFYQRRYDYKSVIERFSNVDLEIEDIVFIAEHPIKAPTLNDDGMLLHNIYYLRELWLGKVIAKFPKLPILPYLFHSSCSKRYHYLTRNSEDENIRQVAIKLRRVAS